MIGVVYPPVPVVGPARAVLSLPTVVIATPAAQAAGVHGCVSMSSVSTRLDPWASGAVEIATRKAILPCSVGLAQARPPRKPPATRKQPPAGLDPVKIYPAGYPFGHWSSGNQSVGKIVWKLARNVVGKTARGMAGDAWLGFA